MKIQKKRNKAKQKKPTIKPWYVPRHIFSQLCQYHLCRDLQMQVMKSCKHTFTLFPFLVDHLPKVPVEWMFCRLLGLFWCNGFGVWFAWILKRRDYIKKTAYIYIYLGIMEECESVWQQTLYWNWNSPICTSRLFTRRCEQYWGQRFFRLLMAGSTHPAFLSMSVFFSLRENAAWCKLH